MNSDNSPIINNTVEDSCVNGDKSSDITSNQHQVQEQEKEQQQQQQQRERSNAEIKAFEKIGNKILKDIGKIEFNCMNELELLKMDNMNLRKEYLILSQKLNIIQYEFNKLNNSKKELLEYLKLSNIQMIQFYTDLLKYHKFSKKQEMDILNMDMVNTDIQDSIQQKNSIIKIYENEQQHLNGLIEKITLLKNLNFNKDFFNDEDLTTSNKSKSREQHTHNMEVTLLDMFKNINQKENKKKKRKQNIKQDKNNGDDDDDDYDDDDVVVADVDGDDINNNNSNNNDNNINDDNASVNTEKTVIDKSDKDSAKDNHITNTSSTTPTSTTTTTPTSTTTQYNPNTQDDTTIKSTKSVESGAIKKRNNIRNRLNDIGSILNPEPATRNNSNSSNNNNNSNKTNNDQNSEHISKKLKLTSSSETLSECSTKFNSDDGSRKNVYYYDVQRENPRLKTQPSFTHKKANSIITFNIENNEIVADLSNLSKPSRVNLTNANTNTFPNLLNTYGNVENDVEKIVMVRENSDREEDELQDGNVRRASTVTNGKVYSEEGTNSVDIIEPNIYLQYGVKISRNNVSVRSIWNEFFEKQDKNLSLADLEKKYGPQWRGSGLFSSVFTNRECIIKAIQHGIEKNNMTQDESIDYLEKCLIKWKKPISYFFSAQNLPESMKY